MKILGGGELELEGRYLPSPPLYDTLYRHKNKHVYCIITINLL